MEKVNLTIRVPRDLVENAKRFAAENHTTLTNLIEAYLCRIQVGHSMDNAPIVSKLSGTVSKDVTLGEYKKHLEEKDI
jgi:hypothetical protein